MNIPDYIIFFNREGFILVRYFVSVPIFTHLDSFVLPVCITNCFTRPARGNQQMAKNNK